MAEEKEDFVAPVTGTYKVGNGKIKLIKPRKDNKGNDILIGYHCWYEGHEHENK